MPVSRRRAVKALAATLTVSVTDLSAFAPAHAQMTTGADFYVSPNGNDAWSGRLKVPNRTKSDGPFATLGRAQKAVRERQNKTSAVTVLVRGGLYSLAEPLAFTEADSGTASAPVTFAAYPGETPIVSGGVRLNGWKKVSGNRYETTVPASLPYFEQLYVNRTRRYRPRLPKTGYYFVAGEVAPSPKTNGKAFDRFRFHAEEIRTDWANRDDIEVLPFHIWTMDRHFIQEVDADARLVTFRGQTGGTNSYEALPRDARYLVENVKEALSDPGEWYLDRPTRTLTYLARPGEDMIRAQVIAPRLEQVLTLNGTQNVTFRGLTFAHTAWKSPLSDRKFWQAEANLGSAIALTGTRDVTFDRCRIENTGAWAIEFGRGAQNCRLVRSELVDLGAGGIKIGEATMRPEAEAAGHVTVSDCLLAQGGRIHNAGVGVWIGHSANNTITHNEIVDFYYTGISPGWSWGYNPTGTHDNEIAYNHIHQIGQGVLSDMGGIYTLGIAPGTVLHHNLIHDIDSFSYGGWGIYFDEGSSGVVAQDNIVYRTKSAPFHQHYGQDNIVQNNIFAFGREAQLMRTRPEDHLSFTARRNLIYYTEGPLLGSNWSGTDKNFKLEDNLYFNASGRPVTFPGGLTLAQWQAKGLDTGSRVADPGFVAPEKGDFTLRPGSPALAMGFKPIDRAPIGRRNAPPYNGKAPHAFPPPPLPRPIADDFEDYAPGDKPGSGVVAEEAVFPGANIRVTNETAYKGKQSLKITDVPGQSVSYSPHYYFTPTFTRGTIVGTFALRHEPGALVVHEWRDGSNPYHTGASLRVTEDGTLFAGDRSLLQLPASQWVRLVITCMLGNRATGKYDLSVQLPDAAPRVFRDLPCISPEFAALSWWGFISNTNGASVFYLDDLSVHPQAATPQK